MDKEKLELYTDYLISTFGYATATGLSKMLAEQISHDQITRFLSQEEYTSKELWQEVKGTVRKIEREDGVLIFDDTIQEKPYTDENEIMCWHYDHSKGKAVQGFNLMNCLYQVDEITIPVAFALIRKPVMFSDLKTRKVKRKSLETKNELMRDMLRVCLQNQLKFRYVLFDMWFSSKENMLFIKKTMGKEFVCGVKKNRLVAISEEDAQAKRFIRIEDLDWSEEMVFTVWLKDVPFAVHLVRQTYENKDGSTGTLYLVSSDTTFSREVLLSVYQKRWPVEVFHKSLKQNAALGKAPVRRVHTQNNHVFAALYAVFKLECLKIKQKMNPFALRTSIYIKATRTAFDELQALKAA
jgi:hypothetical protein